MTATQVEQVFARIPSDLRAEIDNYRRAEGCCDAEVVRRALRAFLSGAEIPRAESLFTRRTRGAARSYGRVTEKRAAQGVTMRRGTACFDVARLLIECGPLTTDQVCAMLPERPVNGTARRVTDLLDAGYAAELLDEFNAPVTRKTRNGADAIVWQITLRGRERYREVMKG